MFKRLDEIVECPFVIECIIDNNDGLSITVKASNSLKYEIVFDYYYAYRNSDEGDLVRYFDKTGLGLSGIYRTTKSEYLDWALAQSIHDEYPENVFHLALVSTDDVFEVICYDMPKISIISQV